jgi:hypothetical protein
MITVHCTFASVAIHLQKKRHTCAWGHRIVAPRVGLATLGLSRNAGDVYADPHRGVAGVAQNDTLECW